MNSDDFSQSSDGLSFPNSASSSGNSIPSTNGVKPNNYQGYPQSMPSSANPYQAGMPRPTNMPSRPVYPNVNHSVPANNPNQRTPSQYQQASHSQYGMNARPGAMTNPNNLHTSVSQNRSPMQANTYANDGFVSGNIPSSQMQTNGGSRDSFETSFRVSRVDSKGHKHGNTQASTCIPTDTKSNGKKKKKPWTKKRVFMRIILPILCALVVLIVGCIIAVMMYKDYLLDQIEYIPNDPVATMIDENGSVITIPQSTLPSAEISFTEEFSYIHNFLLIGTDSRTRGYSADGTGALADVIMVLTVNDNTGSIKMTTIARDSFVYIPEHTNPQKINAAMSIGGPLLLSQVISETLRIPLEGYAYINFYHMEQLIDAVGGVYVDVSSDELNNEEGGLNVLLKEQNHILGDDDYYNLVQSSGYQRLGGRQAVAYSRIRKVGNGDYGRSQRQLEVLTSVLDQFLNMSAPSQLSALDEILSLVATNLTREQIEDYVFDFLPSLQSAEFETMSLPLEGYCNEGIFSDINEREWSMRIDWNGLIPELQQFIYGTTFDVEPVREIPLAPNSSETSDTSTDAIIPEESDNLVDVSDDSIE